MNSEPTLRLGVIVGSLRKGSYSRRIAHALIDRAPSGWTREILEIGNLPLYNQDLDAKPPRAWTRFRKEVAACDALLFVTPEYNRSIPGVLKNATDIGSRPEGENVFDGKPAAVVSVSPYAGGAMAANHALRQSFVFLNLLAMQQPEAYIREADKLVDKNGRVSKKDGDKQLRKFMEAFAQWVERIGAKQSADPFDAFMKKREEVSDAYIEGDAGPLAEISTKDDPATFFPPSGDRVVGADAVIKANRQGARTFRKGSKGRFEVLASGAGRDFAWWSGLQHAQVLMKGKGGPVPMTLRTTEVFRNEGGRWRLIHRHADLIERDARGSARSGRR